MGGTVRVACIQCSSELRQKHRNLWRLGRLVEEAASLGAKIIVAPEMAVCGYAHATLQDAMDEAEPVPGPSTEYVSGLARKFGVYVSLGLAEKAPAEGVFFNSSALIGPQGDLLDCYRKTHLAVEDTTWAVPGDRVEAVKFPAGNAGTLICADVGFSETVRLLALAECGVVLFPMAWAGRSLPADVYFQSRARENGCYLLVSDVVGKQGSLTFHGNSMIVAPDGSILARAQEDEEQVICADIDLDEAELMARAALARRRPELYAGVLRKSFFWQQSSFLGLPQSRQGYLVAVRSSLCPGEVAGNIAALEDLVKASLPGDGRSCVVALPPYTASGFPSNAAEARVLSRTAWDPLRKALESLAKATGACIIGSGVETSGAAMYHSAIIAKPDGQQDVYRCAHPSPRERSWASAGDTVWTVDLQHARLGIMLGDELMIPEISRCLSKAGSDIQCCLSQTGVHWEAPPYVARERATTSGCYVVVSSGSETPAMISGNLDSRLGETQSFLSSGEKKWVRMPHESFDGSWVRNRVRLARLMEHLYGPLVTARSGAAYETEMRSRWER